MYAEAKGYERLNVSGRKKKRKRGENVFDSHMEGDSRVKVPSNFTEILHIKITL